MMVTVPTLTVSRIDPAEGELRDTVNCSWSSRTLSLLIGMETVVVTGPAVFAAKVSVAPLVVKSDPMTAVPGDVAQATVMAEVTGPPAIVMVRTADPTFSETVVDDMVNVGVARISKLRVDTIGTPQLRIVAVIVKVLPGGEFAGIGAWNVASRRTVFDAPLVGLAIFGKLNVTLFPPVTTPEVPGGISTGDILEPTETTEEAVIAVGRGDASSVATVGVTVVAEVSNENLTVTSSPLKIPTALEVRGFEVLNKVTGPVTVAARQPVQTLGSISGQVAI